MTPVGLPRNSGACDRFHVAFSIPLPAFSLEYGDVGSAAVGGIVVQLHELVGSWAASLVHWCISSSVRNYAGGIYGGSGSGYSLETNSDHE